MISLMWSQPLRATYLNLQNLRACMWEHWRNQRRRSKRIALILIILMRLLLRKLSSSRPIHRIMSLCLIMLWSEMREWCISCGEWSEHLMGRKKLRKQLLHRKKVRVMSRQKSQRLSFQSILLFQRLWENQGSSISRCLSLGHLLEFEWVTTHVYLKKHLMQLWRT